MKYIKHNVHYIPSYGKLYIYLTRKTLLKEGDHFIEGGKVEKLTYQPIEPIYHNNVLMATTHPAFAKQYPRPSSAFVDKLVCGGSQVQATIKEVMVELEEHVSEILIRNFEKVVVQRHKLKVAKDKTITIRKIKQTFTRDEVSNLIAKLTESHHGVKPDQELINDFLASSDND